MTLAPVASDQGARAVRDETTSGETGLGLARTTFIALTSMTAATGLLCHPVIGSADFATSSPVFLVPDQPAWPADLWAPAALATAVAPDVAAAAVRSDQDEVLWVKENSGLTWDQLGKVFGVSRRAVHLWANGGRMNEANAEVLRNFAAAIAAHHGGSPERTRAALLAHEGGFDSVVDTFRRAQVRGAGEAIGAPFAPEEKVENIREAEAEEA
jgi:hypothetical protein